MVGAVAMAARQRTLGVCDAPDAIPHRRCHPRCPTHVTTELQSAPPSNHAKPGSHVSRYSLLWIAALVVAVVFVGRDSARLSAPFGPSHDGFNAALYMSGGRAIVEEGPWVSQLGASSRTVSGDRVVYAHHPPLVYLETAAALAAPGSI